MISEVLQIEPQQDDNLSALPYSPHCSAQEIEKKKDLCFEPQKYVMLRHGEVWYIRFHGEESSGMKYFYERETAHRDRLAQQQKEWDEMVLTKKGIEPDDVSPRYSLPTMTTASASEPV